MQNNEYNMNKYSFFINRINKNIAWNQHVWQTEIDTDKINMNKYAESIENISFYSDLLFNELVKLAGMIKFPYDSSKAEQFEKCYRILKNDFI